MAQIFILITSASIKYFTVYVQHTITWYILQFIHLCIRIQHFCSAVGYWGQWGCVLICTQVLWAAAVTAIYSFCNFLKIVRYVYHKLHHGSVYDSKHCIEEAVEAWHRLCRLLWVQSVRHCTPPVLSKSSASDGLLILWSIVCSLTSQVLNHSCWFLLGNAISRQPRLLSLFISYYSTWVHDKVSEIHVRSLSKIYFFPHQSAKSILIYWMWFLLFSVKSFFFFPNFWIGPVFIQSVL